MTPKLVLHAALALTLCACSQRGCSSSSKASAGPPPTASAAAKEEIKHIEGVVRVASKKDDVRGRKQFAGAMLEDDQGTSWVIEYQKASPFHAFRDRRVRVVGRPYTPKHQALVKPHLEVIEMKPAKVDADVPYVEVHGQEELTGRFEEHTFPEGTKLAGEKWLRFVDANGKAYLLAAAAEKAPLGAQVTITAHRVEPSPHAAQPDGAYLWVKRIRTR